MQIINKEEKMADFCNEFKAILIIKLNGGNTRIKEEEITKLIEVIRNKAKEYNITIEECKYNR